MIPMASDDDVLPALGRRPEDVVAERALLGTMRARLFGRATPPQVVGRYTLLEQIGSGGGGDVYLAEDPELQRRLAIKILAAQQDTDSEQLARRLTSEARALASLNHPNVLPVFDVGQHSGRVYLAMEYVEGGDLRDLDDRTELLEAYVAAGHGLAAAHAAGLVHRDFKPANALVHADGRVVVSDFGLARRDGAATTQIGSTEDRVAAVGTPAYMAPEQRVGGSVGPAADQYAYCVALVEALTGTLPERGAEDEALRAVPPRLRPVLARGLELDPDQRWPSMESLVRGVARASRGRQPTRTIALAGAAMLGVVTLAVASWPAEQVGCEEAFAAEVWSGARAQVLAAALRDPKRNDVDETAPRVVAAVDEYVARMQAVYVGACAERTTDLRAYDRSVACLGARRQQLDSTLSTLTEATPSVRARAVELVHALPEPERCAVGGDHEPAPAVVLAKLAEARAAEAAGRHAAAFAAATDAAELARTHDHPAGEAQAHVLRGMARAHQGYASEAEELLELAVQLAQRGGDERTAARAMVDLVLVVGHSLDDADGGARWAGHAEASIERLGGDAELEIDLLDNRGVVTLEQGALADARRLHQGALQRARTELGPDHPAVAMAHFNLGNVAYAAGELEPAQAHYERARVSYERIFGVRHPRVTDAMSNLANVAMSSGDYEGALAIIDAVVARREHEGRQDFGLAEAINNAGSIRFMLGRYEEAQAAFERALVLFSRDGEAPARAAALLSNLGAVAMRRGDNDAARDYLARALATTETAQGPDHPDVADAAMNLGLALAQRDGADAARPHLQRAYDIRRAAFGDDHAKTATALANLANNDVDRGDLDTGIARHREALATRERLGADHPEVAYSLTALGWDLLDLQTDTAVTEAIGLLERGLVILETRDVEPRRLGDVQRALAEALVAAGTDPSRAKALYEAAAVDYDAADLPEKAEACRTAAASVRP